MSLAKIFVLLPKAGASASDVVVGLGTTDASSADPSLSDLLFFFFCCCFFFFFLLGSDTPNSLRAFFFTIFASESFVVASDCSPALSNVAARPNASRRGPSTENLRKGQVVSF